MTKTEHYQLNQWEPGDEVKREDFNADNAKVDAALAEQAKTMAEGLEQANATAASAVEIAKTATFAVGSYTGNGVELADGGQFIELTFRPRFVIISRGAPGCATPVTSTFMLTEHQVSGAEQYATLNETGFTVGQCSSTSYAFTLNKEGLDFSFIAFG